ncbi:MAG TPA: NADPH-dependent FMN reductase [Gemmatimonadaceae bacterium]|jgi:NAD(P)H-dependent FMN reductase
MQILAISGSLREGASNTTLLQAASLLAPPDVTVTLYDAIGSLPHFNPDLDRPDEIGLPGVIADLRKRVGEASGVLISCPEYAHGIPGSFKNLLDWLVGSLEFPGKPVALLNTSSLSTHAPAQLREVLTTMNARIVPGASVTIPIGRQRDANAILADPELVASIGAALTAFVHAVDQPD